MWERPLLQKATYSIMGVKDIDRVMMVQFHQSYSYEDFIMGFRPSATGFELKKGTFYNFCKKERLIPAMIISSLLTK